MATIFNLFLSIFFVLVIGLFAFELSRYLLARDELKTNVEVAALCCETTLVSSGNPTNTSNQSTAQATALQLFQQNSILGQTMSNATQVSSTSQLQPLPGQAQICFQFLDPLTQQPVSGSSTGTLIEATGAYSYAPVFGKFIGLGSVSFNFQVSALSGVPKIDLVLLYDISGPMDDLTPVTLVQRFQDNNGPDYLVTPNPGLSNNPGQGSLGGQFCNKGNLGNMTPNLLPPQQLEYASNITNCQVPTFSEASGAVTQYLRGYKANTSAPPGNYCAPSSSSGSSSGVGFLPYKGVPFSPEQKFLLPDDEWSEMGIRSPLIASENTAKATSKKITSLTKKLVAKNINQDELSLEKLCLKIAGKKIKSDKNDSLDEKLSTISFVPQFSVFQVGSTTGVTSSGTGSSSTTVSTSGVTSSGTGSSSSSTSTGMASLPQYYASSANGCPYAGYAFGGGSHTADKAVVGPAPLISGYCVNGTSPVSYGPLNSSSKAIYTDVVCNLDGNTIFQSYQGSGYQFPSAAALLEAARGNLESNSAAQTAGVDLSYLGVTPQSGYAAYYFQQARTMLEPMSVLTNSTIAFVNELASVSDVHFGLVAFNDSVGSSSSSVSSSISNVSDWFLYPSPNSSGTMAVSSTHPLPNIQLNPSSGSSNSNQSSIVSMLPTLDVWGERNVSLAIQTAVTELTSSTYARSGANKAIVLITCGPPNEGDTASALSAALTQAQTAKNKGIPIYCVSVALSSGDDSTEDTAYNDNNGGIAAVSAHGAKYYRVDYTDSTTAQSELTTVFGNIARQLVTVVN